MLYLKSFIKGTTILFIYLLSNKRYILTNINKSNIISISSFLKTLINIISLKRRKLSYSYYRHIKLPKRLGLKFKEVL